MSGVIGPLLFIAVFLIEGLTRPGYSPWRNAVSQLATGEDGWIQTVNFLVCGVLVLTFAFGLRQAIKGTRGSIGGPVLIGLFAVALLVAGVFTTDPGLGYPVGAPEVHTTHGLIHGFAGLAAFVTIAASAFVIAWHFAAEPGERRWVIYSAAIGLLIPVFFIAFTVASNNWSDAPGGLFQRISIISGWTWLAATAWHVTGKRATVPVALR
jgi:hypothetical membrane protein